VRREKERENGGVILLDSETENARATKEETQISRRENESE